MGRRVKPLPTLLTAFYALDAFGTPHHCRESAPNRAVKLGQVALLCSGAAGLARVAYLSRVASGALERSPASSRAHTRFGFCPESYGSQQPHFAMLQLQKLAPSLLRRGASALGTAPVRQFAAGAPQQTKEDEDDTFELLPPGCSLKDPTYGRNRCGTRPLREGTARAALRDAARAAVCHPQGGDGRVALCPQASTNRAEGMRPTLADLPMQLV